MQYVVLVLWAYEDKLFYCTLVRIERWQPLPLGGSRLKLP